MLKKTMGLLILAVFMLSIVPLAIADNENSGRGAAVSVLASAQAELAGVDVDSSLEVDIDSDSDSNNSEDQDTDKSSDVEFESETETEVEDSKDSSDESRENRAIELRNAIRARVDASLVRVKTKVTAEVVRELAQKFKEKHEQSKEALEEHRAVLLRLNGAVKNCDDSDLCLKAKAELRLGAKNHLLRTLNVIETWLERTANEGSDDAALLLEDLAEVKLHVEALTAESTGDEYNAVIKEVRELWVKAKAVQKKAVGAMIQVKTEETVDKYLGVSNSMQVRIDNVGRLGGDTETLTEIMVKYQELMDELKTKREEAKTAWQAAEDKESAYEAWKASHDEIQDLLEESRSIVREFVQEYTAQVRLTGNVDVNNDSATVDEESEATVE